MDNIINYFNGEKIQCIIGLVISVLFVAASLYFLYLQKPDLKGFAYAVLPLSALLIIICIGVITRTAKDIDRVTSFYKTNQEKIRTDEIPRMETVMRNFAIVKKVEIGIFVAGILLAFFFWNKDLLKGIALGLITQGIILFIFDHLAESRGKV